MVFKWEPTGALTLGALLKNKGLTKPIVAVISGANVDADLFAQIISGEVSSERVLYRIILLDRLWLQ